MKVLFSANIPSPYRTEFFNELGKLCDLTVCYERRSASDRDSKWVGEEARHYREVYLDLKPVGTDKSRGSALRKYISANPADHLILTNYISPACMEAILYCRLKRIPYWVEYDGGFNRKDSLPKRIMKKILIGRARGHLTTCDEHIAYLKSLGIFANRIFKYPFTSLTEKDLEDGIRITETEKEQQKQELGITEEKMLLSVGRFSYEGGYGKGYDTLLSAAEALPENIGVYIVGDEPTEEFVRWKAEKDLTHVHFVGFRQKDELAYYYAAADAFVLLSRKDIWGLVINEAMSFGLPIISTKQCLAATELVKSGVNGYLVDLGNLEDIVEKINLILYNANLREQYGQKSLDMIRRYTIEEMAERHIEILSATSVYKA